MKRCFVSTWALKPFPKRRRLRLSRNHSDQSKTIPLPIPNPNHNKSLVISLFRRRMPFGDSILKHPFKDTPHNLLANNFAAILTRPKRRLVRSKNCFDFNEVNFGSCLRAPAPRSAYPVSLPRNIYCALFVIEIFIVVAQLPSPEKETGKG